MTTLEFDETLLTGDALVDSQHRGIFALFSELEQMASDDCDDAAIESVLERLHSYAMEHFVAEEQLIARSALPAEERSEHIAEHLELTDQVRGLVLEHRTGCEPVIAPAVELLRTWLVLHIKKRDRVLVDSLGGANS